MSRRTVIVTGSAGLIGSQVSQDLCAKGYRVLGIDNDLRSYFFGASASTRLRALELSEAFPDSYEDFDVDMREVARVTEVFECAGEIAGVIHTAAQPSHDWAAREPITDFEVNAMATVNLLELTRRFNPEAPFVFMSTNKVYGDTPNKLPLEEAGQRWDLPRSHPMYEGIDESMTIDHSLHSVFGASKVAADVMVQEYGRYFSLPTACFRGGTLTGPGHASAQLHGFMAYLVSCAIRKVPYTIFGYGGKQVRDVIHSRDVSSALIGFLENPGCGAVFNIGGGRANSCSVLEAIQLVERYTGEDLEWSISEKNRIGDHEWWISSNRSLEDAIPEWSVTQSLRSIIEEIAVATHESLRDA